jgi:hypothetical protein
LHVVGTTFFVMCDKSKEECSEIPNEESLSTPPNLVEKYDVTMTKIFSLDLFFKYFFYFFSFYYVVSKMYYKHVYQDFIDWQQKNNSQSFSKRTLLAFFEEKKVVLALSTLWSIYLILKSTLLSYQNVDLLLYPKLIPFLKRNVVGYQPKKALIF